MLGENELSVESLEVNGRRNSLNLTVVTVDSFRKRLEVNAITLTIEENSWRVKVAKLQGKPSE